MIVMVVYDNDEGLCQRVSIFVTCNRLRTGRDDERITLRPAFFKLTDDSRTFISKNIGDRSKERTPGGSILFIYHFWRVKARTAIFNEGFRILWRAERSVVGGRPRRVFGWVKVVVFWTESLRACRSGVGRRWGRRRNEREGGMGRGLSPLKKGFVFPSVSVSLSLSRLSFRSFSGYCRRSGIGVAAG